MFPLGTNTHIPLAGLEVVCQYNTVTPAAESRCWLKWAVCDAQITGLQRLEETMGLGLNDYTGNIALGSFGVCRDTRNTKLPPSLWRGGGGCRESSTLELLPRSACREILHSDSSVALLVGISPQKSQFVLQGS